MLNYGRVCTHVRFGSEEKDLGEAKPGARWGGPSIDSLISAAADEKAGLEEHLGLPPDDWVMLGSKQLLDTYVEIIREDHPRFGLQLDAAEIHALRVKLLCTCADVAADDRVLPIYPFTDDRATNVLLTTATRGNADVIVTQSRRLQKNFKHPETSQTVVGLSFESLCERMSTSSFDVSSVNPRLW